MPGIIYEELEKGDAVIFARVLPKAGYYGLMDLHINTVNENYCTGIDQATQQTYFFRKEDAEVVLFRDRVIAGGYLYRKKQENRYIKTERK